ncbi:MAG TPA: PKD domain-containing protein, partial [Methanoregulaceae archaeon]|nr:PKD domain-containing protein [Methanoregulaceae archaeon]
WTWTDPSSSDFDHVMVYLNDAFQGNVTKGAQVYSSPGLSPSTAYIIGTRTVGTTGLVNTTWVNQTATTAPDTDPGITPPEAQFISNTTSGTAPLTVQFNDSSNGTVTSYAWDFGDGANSTEKNPVHTYTSYGIYNVSLTVTNTAGEDTIIKNDFIQVNPMVGGDTGYYLIHCNVDGAGVYFDEDYKGVITDGTLLVKIYLTGTPYHRYSVSKAGYITVNEPLPAYPAKDQTKDIFVTLVDVTDNSWTRPPYPEVTRMQPGYPDVNWTRPPYPEVTRIQPGYPDTNWTRPPYPEVTKIQPGYPDTNWTRPPYPEVTKIQPGYPDTNWTRPSYLDWLWNRPSIKNFLKDIFG